MPFHREPGVTGPVRPRAGALDILEPGPPAGFQAPILPPPTRQIGPPLTQQIGGAPAPITAPPPKPIGPPLTSDLGGRTPQQILDALVERWGRGDFASVDDLVAAIQSELGLPTRNAAMEFFRELQTSGRLGEFAPPIGKPPTPEVLGVGAAGGVPTPAPTQVGQPLPSDIGGGGDLGPRTRQQLFDIQEGGDLSTRLLADVFGTTRSPFNERVAQSVLRGFGELDPLLRFANKQQTVGERFAGFAGGARPTGDFITSTLNDLTGAESFLEFVPDFQRAEGLGLSEAFSGVNARLARQAQANQAKILSRERLQRPEQFQDDSSIGVQNRLEDIRNRFRGFF